MFCEGIRDLDYWEKRLYDQKSIVVDFCSNIGNCVSI